MILIGSEAARRRGDLPDWHDGTMADLDLVGSRSEFDDLVGYLRTNHRVVVPHDRGGGRLGVRVPLDVGGRILIDFVTDERASSQALMVLEDHTSGEVFGMSCQVVSALTEYVSKLAYQPFPIHREKNDRWIEHWAEVVGSGPWSDGHQVFHDALRAEYAVTFANSD